MDAKELAAKLSGCEYRDEMTRDEERAAKAAGLVVVFGASDDLMEFRGAIDDEIGCCGGGEAFVDERGLLAPFEAIDRDDKDGLREWFRREARAVKIAAVWDRDGYSWIYETGIPHAAFDVMEDGEKYCRGIVFRLPGAAAGS